MFPIDDNEINPYMAAAIFAGASSNNVSNYKGKYQLITIANEADSYGLILLSWKHVAKIYIA